MADVDFMQSLTSLLSGGGPFAAFVLMIILLEPRFRQHMRDGDRALVFIPVYVMNLLVAVLMLFAAIYFWFIREGVLGGEEILARGNVSSVPLTHVVFSRNEELFLRRDQIEGSGILYDWVILSADPDYSDDLTFLISPNRDGPGETLLYRLGWSRMDRSGQVELEFDGTSAGLCMKLRKEGAEEECVPFFQQVVDGGLPSGGGAGATETAAAVPAFWRGLIGAAHAQEGLPETRFLGDMLRSPDVFARGDARAALIGAGPSAADVIEELIAIDPSSYRINLAVLAALNEWSAEAGDADGLDALPPPVADQVGRWLNWPDAEMRREASGLLARSVTPDQVARIAEMAAPGATFPGSPALGIAISTIYREQARQALEALAAQNGAAEPAAVQAAAGEVGALYGLAYDALEPAGPVGEPPSPVRAVQTRLNALGLFAGPVDGETGQATRAAVERFNTRAGVAGSEITADLDRALLAEQRAQLLLEWQQAAATLVRLDPASAIGEQAAQATQRMLAASPAAYRDLFRGYFASGSDLAPDGPTDADTLYASGLRAVLAGDWARAVADLQAVQKLRSDFRDAYEIERLVRQNTDVFAADSQAVDFAIAQIGGCYGAAMPAEIRAEFAQRAASAGVETSYCPR